MCIQLESDVQNSMQMIMVIITLSLRVTSYMNYWPYLVIAIEVKPSPIGPPDGGNVPQLSKYAREVHHDNGSYKNYNCVLND